jgi:phage baseplate assembly protein W
MEVNYPFKLDSGGRVVSAGEEDHVRQMMEQVLFTSPGERVNRPDFGCGLLQLVFDANSLELAAATKVVVQSALERWLGDRIRVDSVLVAGEDSKLTVTIQYVDLHSGQQRRARFSRSFGA